MYFANHEVVKCNLADGKCEIDTVRDYANGRTEALLGRVMPENLYIGAKINAFGKGKKHWTRPACNVSTFFPACGPKANR